LQIRDRDELTGEKGKGPGEKGGGLATAGFGGVTGLHVRMAD